MSNAVAIPMRTCIYTSANVFDLPLRLPSSLVSGGTLVDPAQCHATQFPLHALARLQYASIRGQEHALSRMGQSLDICRLPRPCDFSQILAGQPYPPRRHHLEIFLQGDVRANGHLRPLVRIHCLRGDCDQRVLRPKAGQAVNRQ